MARFARRTSTRSRQFVRGFDWDGYSAAMGVPTGTTVWDWIRVPSDSVDSSTGSFVAPKTLVKLLISGQWDSGLQAAGSSVDFWFAIIRWSASDDTVTLGSNIPDPRIGSPDWIAWLPRHATNRTAAAAYYESQYGGIGADGGLISIASQRKLPPGEGLMLVAGFNGAAASSATLNISIRIGLKGDVTAPGLGGA